MKISRIVPIAFVLCFSALAQSLPSGVTKGPTVEGITEYQLANGMRVLLVPDQSAATVTVNVTYLVGSRHEGYGESGMAHLLEHLVFKGTPKHPDIPKELKDHGARFNGTTSYDRTNYFEILDATNENLRFGLDLESDRMVNSFIAKKDLDSEMTVVRNEFEMGENNPEAILEERVFSTAYLWHNYGKSVIGSRADIERVPIDRLQAFYKRFYQPDNAVLTIAGKFDDATALKEVAATFGAVPRPSRKLEPTYTEEPTQDGERTVTLRRVGDVQIVLTAYHIPAGTHPDFPALEVLASVLADTPSGRLYKALVDNKKAASIHGEANQMTEPGTIEFAATVRKDDSLDTARDTMLATLASVISEPPTKEEVDRAKAKILKNIDLGLNNSLRVGVQLSEWVAVGDWRMLFLSRDRLKNVTPEDVQRVAKTYLKDSNRTLGVFIPTAKPDRSEIPSTPDVASLVKDYKGGAAVAAGEVFKPTVENIESRVKRQTLPSGLKVVVMPKQTRGNSVVAQIRLRTGDEKSLQGRATAAELTGAMLMRGTAKHTRQQIQDELSRLKAALRVTGSATGASVSIETVRDNLAAVLALAAEILREPSFPDTEFDQVKTAALARIDQSKSEPMALAPMLLRSHLSPYPKDDPRAILTFDEQAERIRAATLDDLKKFYTDFYGASYGEAVVVGDCDAAAVTKQLGELFGGWKTPGVYKELARPYQKVAPINKFVDTPDKANAVLIAGSTIQMKDSAPDYPALLVADFMLGGGALSNRLADRIRRKDGLSYAVQSAFNAPVKDANASFLVFAISAPQNVAKVEAAMKEELARALKDGFTSEELEAAKKGLLTLEETQRGMDAALAGNLLGLEHEGRTLQWDASIEKKIGELKLDEVNAALRKYIDPSALTIVKAGDEKKASAPPDPAKK